MAEYGTTPNPPPSEPPPTKEKVLANNQAKGCVGCLVFVVAAAATANLLSRCSPEKPQATPNSESQGYLQQLQQAPDAATAAIVTAKERETPFTPGVPGRSSSEVCNTTSKACQQWTALVVGCEENMKRRDAGYLGKFERSYCDEAEALREKLTGVALSTSPGAYDF